MIIGIAGEAGSGKNAIGEILQVHYGFCCIALADPIKRYVKNIFDFDVSKLWGPSEKRNEGDGRYPLTVEARDFVTRVNRSVKGFRPDELTRAFAEITGLNPDEHFLNARKPCQVLGTEGVRAVWPAAWINLGMRVARELIDHANTDYSPQMGLVGVLRKSYPGVAITDVRFRNEVEGIRAAGGLVLRVRREGAGLKGAAAAHASEQDLPMMIRQDFDGWIDNDGTLEDLAVEVKRFMDENRPTI